MPHEIGHIDSPHSQIDSEIDNHTLLSLVTGYQTSADIPPLSTTGKVTPENLSSLVSFIFDSPPLPEGTQAPGMGLLEWATPGPGGIVGKLGKHGLLKKIYGEVSKTLRGTSSSSVAKRTTKPGRMKGEWNISGGKREDMMEEAQKFFIPAGKGQVVIPPSKTVTMKPDEILRQKHTQFPMKYFKSQRSLDEAVSSVQKNSELLKSYVQKSALEGNHVASANFANRLEKNEERLKIIKDFKRGLFDDKWYGQDWNSQDLSQRLDSFVKNYGEDLFKSTMPVRYSGKEGYKRFQTQREVEAFAKYNPKYFSNPFK